MTIVSVGVFVAGVRNKTAGGDSHTFGSFECTIHALVPVCEYCGVEAGGSFCRAHCAGMADRG